MKFWLWSLNCLENEFFADLFSVFGMFGLVELIEMFLWVFDYLDWLVWIKCFDWFNWIVCFGCSMYLNSLNHWINPCLDCLLCFFSEPLLELLDVIGCLRLIETFAWIFCCLWINWIGSKKFKLFRWTNLFVEILDMKYVFFFIIQYARTILLKYE